MAKKKQKSGKSAKVVLILIGIGLLLWNANTVCLYLIGSVAPAYDIVTSRTGSLNKSDPDSEYKYSVSYKYTVDGVEYEGLNTGVAGPRLGPKHDSTAHYYPFAPRISSLYAESAVSPGMLILCGFSSALILFAAIPRRDGKKSKASGKNKQDKKAPQNQERVTMAWLMENTEGYDDNLEEYYQNGWDEGDPSWKCSCGKWNTENFCKCCNSARPPK